MPSYVYKCPECGVTREVLHSITAEVQVACSDCGVEMQRKPQAYGLSIKPFGFGGMG